jgi:hypothetical protein
MREVKVKAREPKPPRVSAGATAPQHLAAAAPRKRHVGAAPRVMTVPPQPRQAPAAKVKVTVHRVHVLYRLAHVVYAQAGDHCP